MAAVKETEKKTAEKKSSEKVTSIKAASEKKAAAKKTTAKQGTGKQATPKAELEMAAASEEKVTKTAEKAPKKSLKRRTGSQNRRKCKGRGRKKKQDNGQKTGRKEQTKQTAGEIADGTNSREYGRFADRKCKRSQSVYTVFSGENAGAYGSGHQTGHCPDRIFCLPQDHSADPEDLCACPLNEPGWRRDIRTLHTFHYESHHVRDGGGSHGHFSRSVRSVGCLH